MSTTSGATAGTTPSAPRGRRFSSSHLSERTFAYLLIIPVAILLILIIAYPTGYSLYTSLFEINQAFGIRNYVGLGNYADALTDPDTWRSVGLTVRYVAWVTILSAIVSVLGALLLNETFKGKGLMVALVILPWAVSTYAAAVVWRFMYSEQFGMLNTILTGLGFPRTNFITERTVLPAIAIAHTWQFAPLGIYFMLATLQVIPSDLYKLAKTDRLNAFKRFWYVTMPYLRGPILIFLVLVTAEAARVFDIIWFISGGGPGTASHDLVFQIYKETFVNLNTGFGAAQSWILIVLITGITFIYFWAILGARRRAQVMAVDAGEADWRQSGLVRLSDAGTS
jgi:ABC-type sugar transport system permease subunit